MARGEFGENTEDSLRSQRGGLFHRMLPDSQNAIAHRSEVLNDQSVPFYVSSDLIRPKSPVMFWRLIVTRASVPETAVYENGKPDLWKQNIRSPRQACIFSVLSPTNRPQMP